MAVTPTVEATRFPPRIDQGCASGLEGTLILAAAIESGTSGGLALAMIGVLTSVVSVYYYMRVAYVMYAGEPAFAGTGAGTGSAGAADPLRPDASIVGVLVPVDGSLARRRRRAR